MRCRNCGLLGHRTQMCPSYGPWYPAPGKTKDDYEKLRIKIANLIAADVIAEHEGRELQQEYQAKKPRKARKTDEVELQPGTGHAGGTSAGPAREGGQAEGE